MQRKAFVSAADSNLVMDSINFSFGVIKRPPSRCPGYSISVIRYLTISRIPFFSKQRFCNVCIDCVCAYIIDRIYVRYNGKDHQNVIKMFWV